MNNTFNHYLLPVDGWELSSKALEKIIIFARETKARITVLHLLRERDLFAMQVKRQVGAPEQLPETRPHDAEANLKVIATKVMQAGVQCETTYVVDHRLHQVVHHTAAERACDLILVVPHGQGGIPRFLTGGESEEEGLPLHKIPFVVV
ncbi:universal stress protein [Cupriavidus necator]|uniref:universal stress protein n=1 Tax=Cupriavidus necator TaxID=106590 RepID=UPI0039C0FA2D